MRLLVFQHIDCEHPGSLRGFLAQDRIEWTPVLLHRGEEIPPLEHYDALWVMGGPMDVWDVEAHPWLVAEKAAIRRWVLELEKPFLGLCLGHQLLADALGGTCGPMRRPEIGVFEVALTQEGQSDPLLSGTPARQTCLQWHGVQVAQEPEGAEGLQAMKANAEANMTDFLACAETLYHKFMREAVDSLAGLSAVGMDGR